VPAQRKYPDELREQALTLYFDSTPRPSIRQLATQLQIHPEALRGWIRKVRADRLESAVPPDHDAGALGRLRRENAELRRANAILKSVNAFLREHVDQTTLRT
jgi:transposase